MDTLEQLKKLMEDYEEDYENRDNAYEENEELAEQTDRDLIHKGAMIVTLVRRLELLGKGE